MKTRPRNKRKNANLSLLPNGRAMKGLLSSILCGATPVLRSSSTMEERDTLYKLRTSEHLNQWGLPSQAPTNWGLLGADRSNHHRHFHSSFLRCLRSLMWKSPFPRFPPVRISCISSVSWALRREPKLHHFCTAQERQSDRLIAPSFVLFVCFVVNSFLFLLCSFRVNNSFFSPRSSRVRHSFSGGGRLHGSLCFVVSVCSLRSLWQNLFSSAVPSRPFNHSSVTPGKPW